jgi:hypothetical protein
VLKKNPPQLAAKAGRAGGKGDAFSEHEHHPSFIGSRLREVKVKEDAHGTPRCAVGVDAYSSIASTSATRRPGSSRRNAETTLNTASLKPPTF